MQLRNPRLSLWLFFVRWLMAVPAAQAQTRFVQERDDLVNWYYAATFGAGVYTSGDRTVAVLQLPMSYTLQEPAEDRWGLRVTLSVSIGFNDYQYNDIFNQGLPEGLSTISFVPGPELEKQITPRRRLKPCISGGLGWEFEGGGNAWIYDGGLRSRFVPGEDKGVEFALVNRLSLAGYNSNEDSRQPPGYLAISVLTRRPFSILGIDVDRIGVAVRGGEGIAGFRLFTSLPF